MAAEITRASAAGAVVRSLGAVTIAPSISSTSRRASASVSSCRPLSASRPATYAVPRSLCSAASRYAELPVSVIRLPDVPYTQVVSAPAVRLITHET
ncbi:hypothetical protein [Streptomyces sp. NPDC006510]|uniref:hypothetical protein n=1 Tax=Streptomyces sp. NPDC006510 TaxID=3155600 RepID=UPI0033B6C5C1